MSGSASLRGGRVLRSLEVSVSVGFSLPNVMYMESVLIAVFGGQKGLLVYAVVIWL